MVNKNINFFLLQKIASQITTTDIHAEKNQKDMFELFFLLFKKVMDWQKNRTLSEKKKKSNHPLFSQIENR